MSAQPNTRPTPKVGDTLYSLNIGNAARNRPSVLTPVKVVKVGRLYFDCAREEPTRFPHTHTTYHLDDWREKTGYCRDSQLYASPQEYEDSIRAMEIREDLRRAFSSGIFAENVPLDKLREIHAIVQSCVKRG